MNLNSYSKADLIWIINRALQMASGSNADFYLHRAISELGYKKEEKRIAEADEYAKIADDKRRQYIELLSAYDGKPLASIPLKVLLKADQLTKEAREADEKWCSLMGVKA